MLYHAVSLGSLGGCLLPLRRLLAREPGRAGVSQQQLRLHTAPRPGTMSSALLITAASDKHPAARHRRHVTDVLCAEIVRLH